MLRSTISHEAIKRARYAVGAQAKLLADQMEAGAMPKFDGPDALRLLAMILGEEAAVPMSGAAASGGLGF